ncbi:hypothetical protein EG240_06475 [Paenimyroides tangerinum]|uniref:Uncharacterized protein n=1 Tax=Paenimyroides tangerinum TaxID=2488728 RepID=A0A3P3WFJ0_9FLAO|nr:hypothetical protein [Paenimyroides tangerinum]RRJ91313.1 hypothetical protein EG240_06475 [Paenimyroides tangerinum]
MKKILTIALLMFFGTISAQNEIDEYINTIIVESKNTNPVDAKDLTMKNLFDQFYNEVLQDESGQISEDLLNKITVMVESLSTKNMQLMNLLLVFQDYINEVSENPSSLNSEFQLKIVEAMENEFINLKQDVPVIIYVYKIEALQTNEKFDESDKLIEVALKKFPNSVPIKAYKFLATEDENVKNDLIKNHPNHWFVKQLDLK